MSADPLTGGGLPVWIVIGLVVFGALFLLVVAIVGALAIGNRGAKDGLPEDPDGKRG